MSPPCSAPAPRGRADHGRRPGRVDAIAPSSDFDPAPSPRDRAALRFALLVGAALLVGLALRIAIGLTHDAPSTDETAYLRSGRRWSTATASPAAPRPELHFPPFVPFLLGMGGKVVDDPHTAASC